TPLVVDWRAPVAEPFYRATAVVPMGVVRRRHFLTRKGREILALDDEVFDQAAIAAAGLQVSGEGALLAALEQHRTARTPHVTPAWPRSSASRTKRSEPTSTAYWWWRAALAPARPRSRCTAPRTSSTRTGPGSRRKACC